MSWFDEQLALGATTLADVAGQTVTITRDGVTITGVNALWAKPDDVIVDVEGLGTSYEYREWWVAKEDYVFTVAVSPRNGDRITDTDGTWQVLPLAGKPAYEASGTDWMLRTKMVA